MKTEHKVHSKPALVGASRSEQETAAPVGDDWLEYIHNEPTKHAYTV